jgi:hypothetical protein
MHETKALALQLAKQTPRGTSWRAARQAIDIATGHRLTGAQLDEVTNWTHAWLGAMHDPVYGVQSV